MSKIENELHHRLLPNKNRNRLREKNEFQVNRYDKCYGRVARLQKWLFSNSKKWENSNLINFDLKKVHVLLNRRMSKIMIF